MCQTSEGEGYGCYEVFGPHSCGSASAPDRRSVGFSNDSVSGRPRNPVGGEISNWLLLNPEISFGTYVKIKRIIGGLCEGDPGGFTGVGETESVHLTDVELVDFRRSKVGVLRISPDETAAMERLRSTSGGETEVA